MDTIHWMYPKFIHYDSLINYNREDVINLCCVCHIKTHRHEANKSRKYFSVPIFISFCFFFNGFRGSLLRFCRSLGRQSPRHVTLNMKYCLWYAVMLWHTLYLNWKMLSYFQGSVFYYLGGFQESLLY